jgi:NodT family efflux transporter outer membrane factor (OMF) lipoprotein
MESHAPIVGSGGDRRGTRAPSRTAALHVAAVCLLLSALSGCTSIRQWYANGFKVGPQYGPPPVPIAADWIDVADVRVRGGCENYWWLLFDDPVLRSLIDNAAAQNITLRQAGFRVLEARALRDIAVGTLFPQRQEFTMFGVREQISRNVSNQAFAPEKSFGLWDKGFNLNWELDFWGRFRRAVEAADADLDASVENYDDVLVTLLADTASAYVDYRTFQWRAQLARANAQTQYGTLKIAEVRFRNGQTSELDVAQGRANLAQTQAAIPAFEAAARLANNRLCVLLGIPIRDLGPQLGDAPIPRAPTEVVVGIPADLLRRRPDVRRAERELAAQSARIGIAESDLYPHISITGTIGLNANEIKDLYTSGSLRGAIGPSIRWDILNYGRLINNIRVQDAIFQQLAAAYQNSVLTANEEVENALITFLRTQTQRDFLQQSVDATQRANQLVLIQYREGLVDFTSVFQVQEELVLQQDNEALARGNLALSVIDLYRALGGGWELRLPPAEAAQPVQDSPPPEPAAQPPEELKLQGFVPADPRVYFR